MEKEKDESLTKVEKKYEALYGNLPDDPQEQLDYIINKYKISNDVLMEEVDKCLRIGWKEMKFTLYLVPKPTPRPRYNFSSQTFYVKGAKENKKIIKRILKEFSVIYTRTEFSVKTYQPIPVSSMTHMEVALAQMGFIRPLQNPDWDNLGKTYSDMIQNFLLLNDNIICDGRVEKFYSLKPRVEIYIRYQDNFDSNFNRKKITRSSAYKTLMLPK